MPTTTGRATDFITFTRTSNATVTDSNGFIKWAGHNLLTNSESFDASAWSKGGSATVAANTTVAPNGTTTADKVVSANNTGEQRVFRSTAVPSDVGIRYTFSVFAKADGVNWLVLRDDWSGFGDTSFDLVNGVVGTVASGRTATISAVGSGFYLCTISNTVTASYVVGSISLCLADADNGRATFAGNGTKALILWGAHLYRSDLGGMVLNPARGDAYYPTTPRNLLGFTEDFSNAAWTKTNTTISANAAIAPNGLQTADLIVPNTTSGAHSASQVITSAVSGTTYIASIYVKPFGYAKFGIRENAATGAYATFNLSGAGSVIAQGSGGTGAITALSDGWYRVSMSSAAGSTSFQSTFFVLDSAYSSGAPFGYNWSGDGTSGIYLWGAQLSNSASLDAYSPVYDAAVTSAAYYAPRLDYNPVTLAASGLLVEEQRTNLFLRSAELSNGAVWVPVLGATVAANTVTAPDGTATGDTITFNTTNGNRIEQGAGTAVNGETVTFSIWMKGSGTIRLNVGTDTSVGGSTETSFTLTSSWVRYSVTVTYSSPTGTRRAMIIWRTGDTATNVDVWGAQLELGSFATSYIPTGASTATRTADVASVSTQAFPYSATEGTLVISTGVINDAVYPTVGSLSDTTANNVILLQGSSTGANMQLYVVSGGSVVVNTSAQVFSLTSAKTAAAYKLNDYAYSTQGAAPTADTSATVPTMNTLHFGSERGVANWLNGYIRQITYIPRRLSNAELQSRSV